MLLLTKIFRFEMAHALHGYAGKCKSIHGHSYKLYVTVKAGEERHGYIPAPGILLDFKEIKQLVRTSIVNRLDHQLILSGDYIKAHPSIILEDNLLLWEAEPSAENLLIFIRKTLEQKLPEGVELVKLKLYETNDSYAEWVN
jgi:6-pyruvoyltetrahydropterin/6-carboxytetrahydropterin synthase